MLCYCQALPLQQAEGRCSTAQHGTAQHRTWSCSSDSLRQICLGTKSPRAPMNCPLCRQGQGRGRGQGRAEAGSGSNIAVFSHSRESQPAQQQAANAVELQGAAAGQQYTSVCTFR